MPAGHIKGVAQQIARIRSLESRSQESSGRKDLGVSPQRQGVDSETMAVWETAERERVAVP